MKFSGSRARGSNKRQSGDFMWQTHFIGVLLPDDITTKLEMARHYMAEHYGCKSGHSTPIHVTLVPPFHLPEDYSTDDLVRGLDNGLSGKKLGFTSHLENFSAFGDRTVFGKVIPSTSWVELRDEILRSILEACPGCTKKDSRPFQPHATVANRDIPSGVSVEALQVLNGMNLIEDFPVESISIFERISGRWEASVTMDLN